MFTKTKFVAAVTLFMPLLVAPTAYSDQGDQGDNEGGFSHVLLISIDGMHALDYENCVSANTCPNLAALGQTGVSYTRTSTSKPSDSFPGLMALVTGGTPKTVGAFYDIAYDRILAPPQNDTKGGVLKGTCTKGVAKGTTTEYEEGVDIDPSKVNGGGPYPLTGGGFLSIDPLQLPRDPFNNCNPVYPWNFIRANTIYGVIHAAGGYTAWSDKHAVYAAVSGPTGTAFPTNVDDYYSPDSNSDTINLPGVTLATGQSCDPARDPIGGAWVDSFLNIQCYDQLKVNSILNEIDGKTHDGAKKAPVPKIFGMNFQAVSVGQKLIEGAVKGGYTDAAGTSTANMLGEIEYVDAAIGQMVGELKKKGLSDSTAIIITAKHGQSPVDTHRVTKIPANTPAHLIASLLPASESPFGGGIGPTEDDISLLWLAHSSDLSSAVTTLETNAVAAGIGQIFYGPSLETMFNAPGLPPNGDSRSPDIIVQPNVGVIYSGSGKKQAEHGGFAHDDTNVMLLVSNPHFHAKTVTAFVETTQVAPTILRLLGLNPNKLSAVQAEGTPVLPGLTFGE